MPRKRKQQAYDYMLDPSFVTNAAQDRSIYDTATGDFSPVSSLYDNVEDPKNPGKQIKVERDTSNVPFVGNNSDSYSADAGDSIQDTDLNPYNIQDKDEYRGMNQGFWNKMGAGLGKGLILTGTTAADGIIGTAVGLGNMLTPDEEGDHTSVGSKFWNNPFTKMMNDINNASEQWMPNYYTSQEQQASFLGQMATTNFWADKFIKNIGFTAGAIVDGMITGGASLEAMGAKELAMKLPSAIAQAAMDGDKALGIALQANKDIEIAQEVIKNANKLRNVNRISQGLGSVLSAQGESRFEAIGNSTDFYNQNRQKLDDKLIAGEITKEQYNDKLDQLQEAKEGYGNTDFLANMVLLSVSNATQFKNIFTKGFNPTKAIADGIEGSIESGYTYSKPLVSQTLKASKNILAEGVYEEMGQFAAQKGADDFYQKKFDGKITNQMDDFYKSLYKGLADSYGTREGWDQGLIGSLTGAIGLPGLTKNQKTGKRSLDWQGGIWGDIHEIKHENEFNQDAVDHLNQVLKSDSFKDKHQTLIRGLALEAEKNQAAKEGDKSGVLTAQHSQFINDALHFIRADKYEDFVKNIEATKNSDVNEVKALVNTTDADGNPIDTFKGYTTDQIKNKINKNADDMLKSAEMIKDLHDAYSMQYPEMSEEAKEHLIYTASTLDNVNKRIADINNHVAQVAGIKADDLHDVTVAEDGGVKVSNARFNKEYVDIINQKLADGTLNTAKTQQVKPMLKDLPNLIAQKVKLIDDYKTLTTQKGLVALEKKIEEEKKVETKVAEEQKSSYQPTVDDEIINNEDKKKYKVTDINEDGSYKATLLDSKGKETATTTTIKQEDATLDRQKGQNEDRSDNESLTSDETEDTSEESTRGIYSGLRDVSTSLSISHSDPENKKKVIVRNHELDQHISNSKVDNSKATTLFKIDTDNPLLSTHPEIKDKLSKGEVFTEEEAKKILEVDNTKGLEQLVDTMPISVTYVSPKGKAFTEGIYYHATNYKGILVPKSVRDQGPAFVTAYRLEQMMRNRENRRVILMALLTGKEVKVNVQGVTQGHPNNTGVNRRIDEVFQKVNPNANHNNITLAIGSISNKAWIGDGQPSLGNDTAHVVPGAIYAETTATADGSKALIQLNPSKLSEEHAGILWNAIVQSHTFGQGGQQGKYQGKEVENLTNGQVITLLATYGAKATDISHPDNQNRMMDHLVDKQLFVDGQMMLHYGQNVLSLRDVLNGHGDIVGMRNSFIEWATKNKNYAIKKNYSQMGLELNKPMRKKFKIGSWISEGKDTYAGSLIKHGFIKTDVDEFEKTGSLFHSPVIVLDFSKSGLNIKTAPKEVKAAKTKVATITKEAKEFAPDNALTNAPKANAPVKGTTKVDPKVPLNEVKPITPKVNVPLPIGELILTKKRDSQDRPSRTTYLTVQSIKDFAIGTEILVVASVKESDDEGGMPTEDLKVAARVINDNGKKVLQLLTPAAKSVFQQVARSTDRAELNDATAQQLIDYIDNTTKTYINNAVSASNTEAPEKLPTKKAPKAKKEKVVKEPEVSDAYDDMDMPGEAPDFAKSQEVKEEASKEDITIPEGIKPFNLGNPIITTEQVEDAEEEEPEFNPSTTGNPADINLVDNAPFRTAPLSNVPYKKANIQKETKWIVDKLGDVPVEIVDGLIQIAQTGRQAFGQLRKDSIALSNVAEIGTAYHEAYHRVSLTYLSDTERQGIYNEARKKWKLSNQTDQQVEEILAEKFREYTIQKEADKPTGIINKIGDWFKRLYALVKHVFTGDTRLTSMDIDKLFESVNNYAYLYSKPTESNITNLEEDKWNLEYRSHQLANIRTYKQLQIVTKGIASMLLVNTSNKLKEQAESRYATIDAQAAIKEINWEALPIKIAGFVNEQRQAATDNANALTVLNKSKKQDKLDAVVKWSGATDVTTAKALVSQRFEDATRLANLWQEVHDNYDNVYRERVLDYISNSLNIKLKVDDEEAVSNKEIVAYDKQSFEFSAKDNMLATIKFLISNLNESKEKDSYTGMYHFVALDEMWSSLMADLHNKDTYEEMIEVLRGSDKFSYQQLASILDKGSELMRTQFQTTFVKHRHSFFNTIFFKQENGGYRLYHRNADIQAASEQQMRSWGDLLSMSLLVNQSNKDKLNKDEVANTISHMQAFTSNYKNFLRSPDGDTEEYKVELAELLGMIGISTDSATINKMVNDLIPVHGTDRRALSALIDKIEVGLFSKNSTLYKYANGLDTGSKLVLTPKTLFKNEDIAKAIAEAHAYSHNLDLSDTVLGAEGNKHYAYSDPSYFTDLIKDLKNQEDYEYLMSDPTNRSSFLLDQLQDPAVRAKLNVLTFSAMIQDKKGDDGRGFLDLSPIEDFLTKLSLVQRDIITPPTLADRSTYFMLEGLKRLNVEYTVDDKGKLELNEEVIDQFYKYIVAEKNSIDAANKLLRENSELDDKGKIVRVINWDNLVENYHYITTKSGRDYTKGNAYKYQMFESFKKNFDPTTEAGEKIAREHIRKMLEKQIDTTLAMMQRLTIVNLKMNADEDVDNLKKYKVVSNNLLDEQMLEEYLGKYGGDIANAVRAIAADYTVNTMITGAETPMMFMGSLAFYKNKNNAGAELDDYTKRLSVLTSSGSLMRAVIPGEFEDDQCRMATLTTNIIHSSYYDQLVKKQKELLKLKYPELSDKKLDDYAKLRMKQFTKVDPTDAQVLISPIMFKRFALSEGKWNDKVEEAFNLLASDREYTPEEEARLMDLVMQPLKHVYFDRLPISLNNEGDNLLVPTYVKMSEATLFRRFTKGTYLDEVLDRMEGVGKYAGRQQVHMVAYETAVKVGLKTREKLFGEDNVDLYGNETPNMNDLSQWSVTNLNIDKFRHQTVTDPHEEQHTLLASQMKKLGMGDIPDSALYNIPGFDKPITGLQLVTNINNALSALSDKGMNKLIDKLGLTSNGKMDEAKFYSMLLEEAKKSGMPETVQESLRLGITMDALSERKWVYQKLVSKINTTTIDAKLPGNQLIQVSGFGTAKIDSEKTNDLRFMFDDKGKIKGVEAKVSLQVFRSIIPNYEKLSYPQRREWLLNNKGAMEGLGYRIPTQGQNSIVPITVTDFLPETIGDVIILPNEFTALTGSDFDIDKLFFVRYNYHVNRDGVAVKEELSTGMDKESVDKRYEEIVKEAFRNGNAITTLEAYHSLRVLNDARLNAIATKLNLLGDKGVQIGNVIKEIKGLNEKIDIENRRATKDQSKIDALTTEAMRLTNNIEGYNYFTSRVTELEDLAGVHFDKLASILVAADRIPSREEFEKIPILQQNSEEAIQNHLLDHYRSVLLSDNNFLQASSPLDFQTAEYKKKAEEVREAYKTKDEKVDLWWTTPTYQAGIKYKFTGGKSGVGPAALNNAFHVMAQVSKLELKGYYGVGIRTDKGDTSLHEIYSTKDKDADIAVPISDYLSAAVSLHVDIAKDTSIIDLNVVGDTYNVFYFLLHVGEGSKAVDFLPQPILKDLVRELNTVEGAISTSDVVKVSTRKQIVKKEIEAKWDNLYQKALETSKLSADDIQKEMEFYNPFLDNLVDLYSPDTKRDALWYAKQIAILNKFNDLDKGPAKDLSAAIMSTRVDTKKYGGDPIAIKLYQNGVQQLIEKGAFNNLDKLLSLDRTDDTSFLSTYTKNSIDVAEKLFKDKTIIATPVFNKLLDLMIVQTGKAGYAATWEITKMADEMYSAFMSRFFTDKDMMGMTKEDIAKRIQDTVNFIKDSNKVEELKENVLVNAIRQGLTVNEDIDFPGFTGVPSVKSDDNFVKEDMTFAWTEMLQSNDPKIREFANNLFIYAFYTSGFNQRAYSLAQFVPAKMKQELKISYTNSTTGEVQNKILNFDSYMKGLIDKLSVDGISTEAFGINQDVLMNNYSSPTFVKQIDNKQGVNRINTNHDNQGKDVIHHPIVVTVRNDKTKGSLRIGKNAEGVSVYSPYIHFIANKDQSFLMEFIGYHVNNGNPIYKLVNKRGYTYQGRVVKEFGLDGTMLKQNRAYIISDQMAIERMGLERFKEGYGTARYLSPEERNPKIDELIALTVIDDVNPVVTSTSDNESNEGAKNSLKSSISDTDITQEEIDKAKEELDKHCNI